MRKPTLTPSTLRDTLWEVLAEGAWDANMATAERAAVEHALAAALTPLVRDRATRDDVAEYLHLLDTADSLEMHMPQTTDDWKVHESWETDKDGTEYRLNAIGNRIVDGGRPE